MAILHEYGTLLLAARLRRVSETLYAGVDEVYRSQGVTLPARCFPILLLLRDHGRLGISELALQLGQSHPAVSQMSRKLLRHGVVREWPDPEDERRRLLGLSRRGARLLAGLVPVWGAIVGAVAELEAAQPLSAPLTAVDTALGTRSFAARIRACMGSAPAVRILPFAPRYAADFRRLNLEWLQKYFRVEPIDEQVLSNPQRIVRDGGAVFFARVDRRIVGTCALINEGQGRFELSKMAVSADIQGLGIGRKLLTAAIEAFAVRGGRKLFLETNSVLKPAIKLYESVGFVHARPPTAPGYDRANVYMEYRGNSGGVNFRVMLIRAVSAEDFGAVVRINTEAEEFLNSQASLTAAQLPSLIAVATLFNVACLDGAVAAFIVAVRSGIDHDDPNYRWFAARYPEFLYVDRIIVAAGARGQGLGSRLYEELFAAARRLQTQRITCEIDCDPPNKVSLRLHERFGFREVGRHAVDGGKKMVFLQAAPVGRT